MTVVNFRVDEPDRSLPIYFGGFNLRTDLQARIAQFDEESFRRRQSVVEIQAE